MGEVVSGDVIETMAKALDAYITCGDGLCDAQFGDRCRACQVRLKGAAAVALSVVRDELADLALIENAAQNIYNAMADDPVLQTSDDPETVAARAALTAVAARFGGAPRG